METLSLYPATEALLREQRSTQNQFLNDDLNQRLEFSDCYLASLDSFVNLRSTTTDERSSDSPPFTKMAREDVPSVDDVNSSPTDYCLENYFSISSDYQSLEKKDDPVPGIEWDSRTHHEKHIRLRFNSKTSAKKRSRHDEKFSFLFIQPRNPKNRRGNVSGESRKMLRSKSFVHGLCALASSSPSVSLIQRNNQSSGNLQSSDTELSNCFFLHPVGSREK